ncbi:hypothetical protein P9112_010010 [Eukaryota sp. TZLM1-RC]
MYRLSLHIKRDVKGLDSVWLVYTSSSQVMAQFLDDPWVVGNICQEPTLSQDAFVNHYLGRTNLISASPYRDTNQIRSLPKYDGDSFREVYPPMSPPPLNNNEKRYFLPMNQFVATLASVLFIGGCTNDKFLITLAKFNVDSLDVVVVGCQSQSIVATDSIIDLETVPATDGHFELPKLV